MKEKCRIVTVCAFSILRKRIGEECHEVVAIGGGKGEGGVMGRKVWLKQKLKIPIPF